MRSRASILPSLGRTAMSIFCVVRWRSVRGMIDWLCTQERWNPEDVIVGTATRCHRATAGSSHSDAHPDRIIRTTQEGRLAQNTCFLGAFSAYYPVRAHIPKSSKCYQLFSVFRGRALFVRGMLHPYT
jgi:hypothetical protein